MRIRMTEKQNKHKNALKRMKSRRKDNESLSSQDEYEADNDGRDEDFGAAAGC